MNREQVEAWLAPAIERGGNRYHMPEIWKSIEEGRRQLWLGEHGAAVTEILNFATERILHVLLAGGDMAQIRDFEESAAAWGRAQGCTKMTLCGRKGWERVLTNWRPVEVIMERGL